MARIESSYFISNIILAVFHRSTHCHSCKYFVNKVLSCVLQLEGVCTCGRACSYVMNIYCKTFTNAVQYGQSDKGDLTKTGVEGGTVDQFSRTPLPHNVEYMGNKRSSKTDVRKMANRQAQINGLGLAITIPFWSTSDAVSPEKAISPWIENKMLCALFLYVWYTYGKT